MEPSWLADVQWYSHSSVRPIWTIPRQQSSWGQHGAHLGPVGPRWAPCWPHEPYYQGTFLWGIQIIADAVTSQPLDQFAPSQILWNCPVDVQWHGHWLVWPFQDLHWPIMSNKKGTLLTKIS